MGMTFGFRNDGVRLTLKNKQTGEDRVVNSYDEAVQALRSGQFLADDISYGMLRDRYGQDTLSSLAPQSGVTYANYQKSLMPDSGAIAQAGLNPLSDTDRQKYYAEQKIRKDFEDAEKDMPTYEQTDIYKQRQNELNNMLNVANTQGLTSFGQTALNEQNKNYEQSKQELTGATGTKASNAWDSLASAGGADTNLQNTLANRQYQQGQLGQQKLGFENQQNVNKITSNDEALKQQYKDKYTQGTSKLAEDQFNFNTNRKNTLNAMLANMRTSVGG
jgi:hypothetical protein